MIAPTQADDEPGTSRSATLGKGKAIEESKCSLTSIKEMRDAIIKEKHIRTLIYLSTYVLMTEGPSIELDDIIKNHTFVGIVDLEQCISMVQHSTELYLLNHDSLA